MSFRCDKCDKDFSSKQLLSRHEKRKTPCSKTSDLSCAECGQKFSNRTQLHDHVTESHNVFDPSGSSPPAASSILSLRASEEIPKPDARRDVEDATADGLKDRDALLKELRHIRQIVRGGTEAETAEHQSTGTAHVTNTDASVASSSAHVEASTSKPLQQFGRETQDFLERLDFDELKKALKLTPTLDTVYAMVKLVHFNSKHPENRTVKLDSGDDDRVKIFRRGQWRSEDTRDTILNMIARNRLRFYDVEHLMSRNMRKKSLQTLEEFLDDVEDIANKNKETDEDFETLIEDIREELYQASLTEVD